MSSPQKQHCEDQSPAKRRRLITTGRNGEGNGDTDGDGAGGAVAGAMATAPSPSSPPCQSWAGASWLTAGRDVWAGVVCVFLGDADLASLGVACKTLRAWVQRALFGRRWFRMGKDEGWENGRRWKEVKDTSVFDMEQSSNVTHLEFGDYFNQSLEGVNLPAGLQHLQFGRYFNRSLEGANLPAGLLHLQFGTCFKQSLEGVNLPAGLLHLTFGYSFNQSLEGVNLPAGLQHLKA